MPIVRSHLPLTSCLIMSVLPSSSRDITLEGPSIDYPVKPGPLNCDLYADLSCIVPGDLVRLIEDKHQSIASLQGRIGITTDHRI